MRYASPAQLAENDSGMSARFGNLPAWLVSVLFHAGLLVVLGMFLRLTPGGVPQAELSREVGIVLKHHTAEGDYFETEDSQAATDESASDAPPLPEAAFAETPPVDLAAALPATTGLVGPAPGDTAALPAAGGLTEGTAQPRAPTQGKARTSVFGLEGEGYKFVYVFDRSASMGSGRGPLGAAKAQLLASLQSLEAQHQFQIIFYNHEPTVMNLAGDPSRLVFGNDQTKALAERFVRGITAAGGTDHEPALEAALRMAPDVIFFLTDADYPELSAAQLDRIRRRNGGRAVIHCIEFGIGPALRSDNFLTRLAAQNGGKHVYIDISRL